MRYDSRTPIYLQVIDQLRKRLVQGDLRPGDRFPSTRALALEYEVNPNTAARIYREMEAMGLCQTERGLGTFVAGDSGMITRIRREMASELTRRFVREMTQIGFTGQEMVRAIEEEFDHADS